jgi:topoisomerase-4 subunit A
VRARTGHGHDASGFAFKAGDGLYGTFECRTVDTLLVFGSPQGGSVRVYSVAVSTLPGARGDGAPVTTMIDLEPGTQAQHFLAAAADALLLLTHSGAYGLLAKVGDMIGRNKGGKAFLTVEDGEKTLAPIRVASMHTQMACASHDGRLLVFGLDEVKHQPNGGRGLMLMSLEEGDRLSGATTFHQHLRIHGIGRGAKVREDDVKPQALVPYTAKRGRKGKAIEPVVKQGKLFPLDPNGPVPSI